VGEAAEGLPVPDRAISSVLSCGLPTSRSWRCRRVCVRVCVCACVCVDGRGMH